MEPFLLLETFFFRGDRPGGETKPKAHSERSAGGVCQAEGMHGSPCLPSVLGREEQPP